MKKTLKLGEVFNLHEGLYKFNSLTGKVGFRIWQSQHDIESEARMFQEKRNALIEKYGENGSVNSKSDNWKDFEKEFNELLNYEVEVKLHGIPKSMISEDTLYCDGADMAAYRLVNDYLVVDDEEEKKEADTSADSKSDK